MKLKNARIYFESLAAETNKKSKIKVYNKFIQIISSLEKRNLSESEIESIEKELDALSLDSSNEKFSNALRQFEKYLKQTFSLTTKEYYQKLYGGLGLLVGLLFGVIFLSNLERSLGISYGLIGGMVVGSLIGRQLDAQAKTAGNLL
ncbi:MAG: hypothetical protein ACI9IP_002626 [Arcticibacterium sp.]|jgi:hypothetical protein